MTADTDTAAEMRRRRWRCRRGMRELDVILERYLLRDAPCAGAGELAVFDQILELPDPDLARYLVAGDSAADPATRALLERLRTA